MQYQVIWTVGALLARIAVELFYGRLSIKQRWARLLRVGLDAFFAGFVMLGLFLIKVNPMSDHGQFLYWVLGSSPLGEQMSLFPYLFVLAVIVVVIQRKGEVIFNRSKSKRGDTFSLWLCMLSVHMIGFVLLVGSALLLAR